MLLDLLRSRRFAPLFWCQFFSAFNDNFVRNMLAILILFRVGGEHAGALVTAAVGLFILPSIVLSGLGGELADAYDKALIARRLKFAEIGVQLVAAAGFVSGSLVVLYAALFGLGVLSALFGPIKYGILPDHLETRELPAGNALVEGATFLAILFGLVLGGFAAAGDRPAWTVVAQLALIALLCWGSSRFIPATAAGAPGLRIDRNPLRSTWRLVAELRSTRRIWIGGLAVSWFWTVGAIALSVVPVLVRRRIGGGIDVETAVSAAFAIGIGAGSLAAAALAHGRLILWPVPIAALVMAAGFADLALGTMTLPLASADIGLAAFLGSPTGLRVAFDVLVISTAGGLFVVPIFAAVQAWAGEDRRARTVAGVNIVTSLAIVAGSAITAVLQIPPLGWSEPALLAVLAVLNIAVAAWVWWRMPQLQGQSERSPA